MKINKQAINYQKIKSKCMARMSPFLQHKKEKRVILYLTKEKKVLFLSFFHFFSLFSDLAHANWLYMSDSESWKSTKNKNKKLTASHHQIFSSFIFYFSFPFLRHSFMVSTIRTFRSTTTNENAAAWKQKCENLDKEAKSIGLMKRWPQNKKKKTTKETAKTEQDLVFPIQQEQTR